MRTYWITAADHNRNVIYNKLVTAPTLALALENVRDQVPAEHHDSICVTDEDNNPITEDTMNQDILKHMALAFFGSAYADQADEAEQSLSGEIMDQLPADIDPAAMHAARTLYMDLERTNGKPMDALFEALCDATEGDGDREHTEEMFGHYAAMQAMGHGVGLDDAFGSKARELVNVPYVEFGAYSLEADYFA